MDLLSEVLKINRISNSEERHSALKSAPLNILNEYLCVFTTETDTRRFVQSLVDRKRHETLTKPHWSITPTFWIGIFIAILTSLTFYFQVLVPVLKDLKAFHHNETSLENNQKSSQEIQDSAKK